MNDILRQLYENDQTISDAATKEYRMRREAEMVLWKEMEPLIDMELIDKISNAQAASLDEANFIWFRKGFRLGASLMLELL